MNIIENKAILRTTDYETTKQTLRANYHEPALSKKFGTSTPTKKLLEYLEQNPEIKEKIRNMLDLGVGKGRDEDIYKETFNSYFGCISVGKNETSVLMTSCRRSERVNMDELLDIHNDNMLNFFFYRFFLSLFFSD
jgi:hypothetical protein